MMDQIVDKNGVRWLCPFCMKDCFVHFDCECGAKAVNSALWFEKDIPMMRSADLSSFDIVAMAFIGELNDQKVKRMIAVENKQAM